MRDDHTIKRLWIVSLVLLIIMPSLLLVMPYSASIDTSTDGISLIVVGLAFWATFVGGYTVFLVAVLKKRKIYEETNKWHSVFKVFANKCLIITDTVFFGSLVWLLINIKNNKTEGFVILINLFLLVLSFNMHVLFGSNLYRYISGREG